MTTFRVESWPCGCFNHHAFFGAWPKLLPSEVTFRNVSLSTPSTADTTFLCKLLPPQPCHIPAFLAPTATAFVMLHHRAHLCHNCTPSSHKFSTVDSRPVALQSLLPDLPMPQLSQFSAVPHLLGPRSCSTAVSKLCPTHGQAPQADP